MAETINIAAMGRRLSKELFGIFGWKHVGSYDRNWKCEDPEHHNGRSTHPTDAVWSYEDPYSANTILVNTDLKAYKETSITAPTIGEALESLSMAVECAHVSDEWQKAYAASYDNWTVVGLLFVFNTDGKYADEKFPKLLDSIDSYVKGVPETKRLVVMGPSDVRYLFAVALHLDRAAKKGAPRFYYNQRVLHRARQGFQSAASLEMLLGPWLIATVDETEFSAPSFLFYYRGPGKTINEFVYLIDVIFRLELLREERTQLDLVLGAPAANAIEVWGHAVNTYVAKYNNVGEIQDRLAKIKVTYLTAFVPQFSAIELGSDA